MDKLAIAKYKAWDMGDKSITKVSAATAPRQSIVSPPLSGCRGFSGRSPSDTTEIACVHIEAIRILSLLNGLARDNRR